MRGYASKNVNFFEIKIFNLKIAPNDEEATNKMNRKFNELGPMQFKGSLFVVENAV